MCVTHCVCCESLEATTVSTLCAQIVASKYYYKRTMLPGRNG